MYIVELFIKLKNDFLSGKFKKKKVMPDDIEKCDHMFIPIDSTKKVLACSKCGMVYKLKDGEVNPFK